jgi:hypothetical protein
MGSGFSGGSTPEAAEEGGAVQRPIPPGVLNSEESLQSVEVSGFLQLGNENAVHRAWEPVGERVP